MDTIPLVPADCPQSSHPEGHARPLPTGDSRQQIQADLHTGQKLSCWASGNQRDPSRQARAVIWSSCNGWLWAETSVRNWQCRVRHSGGHTYGRLRCLSWEQGRCIPVLQGTPGGGHPDGDQACRVNETALPWGEQRWYRVGVINMEQCFKPHVTKSMSYQQGLSAKELWTLGFLLPVVRT